MRRILALLLFNLAYGANADIYGWRDSAGSAHYSDRPQAASAKVLDIKPGYGYYTVKKVFDGDTLVLEDGRKVRLLGVNTPEIAHRNQPEQAGGEAAKRWLSDKLQNRKVRLEMDAEAADKYGRTLAHVFTEQNEHINLQLVEQGLAAVNIYPPNLLYALKLVKAEQGAQNRRLGIWGRPEYDPIPVERLPASGHPGWTRITGRIADVRSSRKFVYLKFSDQFEVRIEKMALPLFPDLSRYLGQAVEVRGWLNKNKGGYSMLVRHPSAVVLEPRN
ncbi:thermonuclease family protein [Methylomicrobium lacus]|uniref:thermonuclease family protein n=1 Tax=Methylomicrobium lacus TaxID=136992 RepID=UPI0035A92298